MGPHRHLDAALVRRLRERFADGDEDFVNFNTFLTGAQYSWFHSLCAAYLHPPSAVLDWGAGNGHASEYLLRAGHRVTAYSFEPPRPMPPSAADRYRFVPGASDEPVALPFPSRSFDAVCSVGVLEHVREFGGEEAASLAELRRVTRPGGVLLCVHLPNSGSWIEAVIEALGISGHVHRYRYRVRDIQGLCAATGWRVIRTRRYGILPRNRTADLLTRALCDSPGFVRWYDAVDELGALLLPWFAQNHLVVAEAV